MTKSRYQYILTWLFFLLTGGTAMAQDGFDPVNPPDPFYYDTYKVTVTANSGNYTSGEGRYEAGTMITIRTSARSSDFVFICWKMDRVVCSESASFTYIVEEKDVVFEAVWEYSPENPSDPQMTNQFRLYLQSNREGACSFNRTSGDKVEAGETITVVAYPNQSYDFQGWYEGGELISSNVSFNYTMPEHNSTLEAHFVFNPDTPGDPSGGQDDMDNPDALLGDVNRDGSITIADVTALVNVILGKDNAEPYVYNHRVADVNGDGSTTIADVTALVNIILGKN